MLYRQVALNLPINRDSPRYIPDKSGQAGQAGTEPITGSEKHGLRKNPINFSQNYKKVLKKIAERCFIECKGGIKNSG